MFLSTEKATKMCAWVEFIISKLPPLERSFKLFSNILAVFAAGRVSLILSRLNPLEIEDDPNLRPLNAAAFAWSSAALTYDVNLPFRLLPIPPKEVPWIYIDFL